MVLSLLVMKILQRLGGVFEHGKYLMDGDYSMFGMFGACLLTKGYENYLDFTLNADVKMLFSSNSYSDYKGESGQNAIFYKENNGEYDEVYYTLQQQNNEIKYGEYVFPAGKYRLIPEANYVTFDEWDFEIVN